MLFLKGRDLPPYLESVSCFMLRICINATSSAIVISRDRIIGISSNKTSSYDELMKNPMHAVYSKIMSESYCPYITLKFLYDSSIFIGISCPILFWNSGIYLAMDVVVSLIQSYSKIILTLSSSRSNLAIEDRAHWFIQQEAALSETTSWEKVSELTKSI